MVNKVAVRYRSYLSWEEAAGGSFLIQLLFMPGSEKFNTMGGILSKRAVLQKLRRVDPYEFGTFIAKIWENRGYNATIRDGSGDRGIDVEAGYDDEKHLIQVKRYSADNKVTSQEVRKYATLYQQVDYANQVILVTSGYFTSEAKELAQDLNVEAIDGDSLFQLIDRYAVQEAASFLETNHSDRGPFDKSSGGANQGGLDNSIHNRADAIQVFNSLNKFRRLTNKQGIFEGCPECCEQRVCLGQRKNDRVIELKCPDCGSHWVEIFKEEGWWIFSRNKHYGFALRQENGTRVERSTEEWNRRFHERW